MLSALAAEHVAAPRNQGELANATHDGIGWAPWLMPGDGPRVHLWFIVEGEGLDATIRTCTFDSNACPSSVACGSMVTQILTGRLVSRALLLTADDLRAVLGGLPEGKEYCAAMAISAIHEALEQEAI